MTNKTRKHIWPVSLMMSIAIIGALAAFLVLANNPGVTMAHDSGEINHDVACDAMTDAELKAHNAAAFLEGEALCDSTNGNGDANGNGGMTGDNAPSAPMNVQSEALDNMILVRWNKPKNIGPEGAEIMYYVITRTAYTSDVNSPIRISGGKTMMVGSTVREYRDQGLGYNTIYSHTVKAVNTYTVNGVLGSSTGPDSAPVTTATATSGGLLLPELAPPSAPMALSTSAACAVSITLRWEAPVDAGKVAPDTVGCPVCANQTPAHTGGTNAGIQVKPGTAMIVNYMVERSVNGGNWQTLTSTATGLLYNDEASLAFGNSYNYRVTAMNNAGLYGEASDPKSISLTDPTVPNVPQSPDADLQAEDASKVLFTWDPPPGDWRSINDINAIDSKNLSRSLKYHVERRLEGTGDWKRLTVDASGNNAPQVHEYLNNVTKAEALRNIQTQAYEDDSISISGRYKYRVAALIDGCRLSPWVVTAREVVVTLNLGPASDLSASVGSVPGTVILSWTSGPNSTEHWVAGIKQSDWDAGNYSNVIFTSAQSNSYSITGLDSGAEYVFAISAGHGGDWSAWTPLIKVTPN